MPCPCAQLRSAMNARMKQRRERITGLSLLEVLISLLILSIGAGFSIRIFISGRYFINNAESKSKAIRIASMQMERYLSKSYAGLEALIASGAGVIAETYPDDSRFTYTVTLTSKEEINAVVIPNLKIPYVQVEVVVSYNEDKISGGADLKQVRLVNLVPYPYYHIESAMCNFVLACGGDPAHCVNQCPRPLATTVPQTAATLDLTFKTRKNLLIIYNLGIHGVLGTGIGPMDLIQTQCYLNAEALPIVTGTPILTEPFISNVVAKNDVEPPAAGAPQTVTIKWWKTAPAGTVELKWVNVIVLEIEP